MGFLGRIFGKSETRQYTIDEAMKLIEGDLARLQSEKLDQSYRDAVKVHLEISQLSRLIEDFSFKPTPELGKSSANVKERFCTLAKKQLSSFVAPSKEKPDEFLAAARLTMENLGGLTQRQVLHINFFFKEDFRPVGKKINEINALLQQNTGISDSQKAVGMRRKLESLQKQREQVASSIEQAEENLRQVESRKHELPPVLKKPDNHVEAIESRLRAKKQELDSFLSIQKTLKKYVYIYDMKDPILVMYIESPSNALILDENMSILEHLTNAYALAEQGKIEHDRKIAEILSAGGYLNASRLEMIKISEELASEKESYLKDYESFESSVKHRSNYLADLESEEKNIEKFIKSYGEEIEKLSREISATKAELTMLASKILDADVA